MEKRECIELNEDGTCKIMFSEGPCDKCCMNCGHAIEMDCTMVCPDAAEYHHPEES